MINIYSKIRIYLLTFLNICLSELLTSLLLEPATLRVTKMWRYFYFQLRWQREPNIRNLNLLFCIFCQSGLVSQIWSTPSWSNFEISWQIYYPCKKLGKKAQSFRAGYFYFTIMYYFIFVLGRFLLDLIIQTKLCLMLTGDWLETTNSWSNAIMFIEIRLENIGSDDKYIKRLWWIAENYGEIS